MGRRIEELASSEVSDAARTQIGKLTHIARGDHPDIAVRVGFLAPNISRFTIADVSDRNKLILPTQATSEHTKYVSPSLILTSFRTVRRGPTKVE